MESTFVASVKAPTGLTDLAEANRSRLMRRHGSRVKLWRRRVKDSRYIYGGSLFLSLSLLKHLDVIGRVS